MATTFNIDGLIVRHGTSDQWAASNRILLDGELGVDTDKDELRMGDGVNLWANLVTFVTNNAVQAYVAEAIANSPSIGQADLDAVADLVMSELELPDLVLLWENAKA